MRFLSFIVRLNESIIKCGKYACCEINLHKSNIAINVKKLCIGKYFYPHQRQRSVNSSGQGVRKKSVESVRTWWSGKNTTSIYGRWQWQSYSTSRPFFNFRFWHLKRFFCDRNCPLLWKFELNDFSVTFEAPSKSWLVTFSTANECVKKQETKLSFSGKIYSFEIAFQSFYFGKVTFVS